jgi:5-methylcytosine-specific restriction protein A
VKRPCLGCGRLISSGARCADCQCAMWRHKNVDRPPGERVFYSSAAWRNLAARVVAEAGGICQGCGTTGVPLTGGHLISIRRRPDLALDPENVRAECRSCQRNAAVAAARMGGTPSRETPTFGPRPPATSSRVTGNR